MVDNCSAIMNLRYKIAAIVAKKIEVDFFDFSFALLMDETTATLRSQYGEYRDRRCFKCEKILESAGMGDVDDISNPPSDATFWTTPGNWGSRVFDNMSDLLEMYICDDCLLAGSELVYRYNKHISTEIHNVRKFKPDESL